MPSGRFTTGQRYQMGFGHAIQRLRHLAGFAPSFAIQAGCDTIPHGLFAHRMHGLSADTEGGTNRFIGPAVGTPQ